MSRYVNAHVAIRINRPADAVWAVAGDRNRDAEWRHGGDPLTDAVVIATGPGRSSVFAGSGSTGAVRGGRSVQPAGGAVSVFRYDIEAEADGIGRVARYAVGWRLRHSLRRDARRLRSMLEATAECGAPTAIGIPHPVTPHGLATTGR
jgi:hypothetical protein